VPAERAVKVKTPAKTGAQHEEARPENNPSPKTERTSCFFNNGVVLKGGLNFFPENERKAKNNINIPPR